MEAPGQIKLPPYVKLTLILVGAIAVTYILYVGAEVFIPLVFALFASILLNPFVMFLARKGLHPVLAISLAVVLALLFFAGLLAVMIFQLSMFVDTYPNLRERLDEGVITSVNWFSDHFDADGEKVLAWLDNMQKEAVQIVNRRVGPVLLSVGGTLGLIFLIPVYIFLMLLYKTHFLEFIRQLFHTRHHKTVVEVLISVKTIIQRYLFGLILEGLIMATLNSVALLALGIKNAILLGITGAILNVIPYIGGVVGALVPIVIALVTKSPLIALLVMVCYIVIQLIDNHIVVPYVVASRVKINALAAIVAVISASMLWGIPGMFLCIPITALAKVIFDHIKPLHPWGYLFGDHTESVIRLPFPKRKKKE